jgi:DNA-binding NarL/FixJ family response regulator
LNAAAGLLVVLIKEVVVEGYRGRVAVVCDQPMARAGWEQVVAACPGLALGASVAAPDQLAQSEPYDDYAVTVLDMPDLPYRHALEVIAKLATVGPPVVSWAGSQPRTLPAVLRAGARGLVTPRTDRDPVRRTLLTVAAGGMSVAPELTTRFLAEVSFAAEASIASEEEGHLAPREVETLRYIALGYTHSQIATRMGLSTATVNTYAKRIRAKLNVNNKAALTRVAIERGHLEPGARPPAGRPPL